MPIGNDSAGNPVAARPLRIVEGLTATDETGKQVASIPIRYVSAASDGTTEALQAEIVSDLVVTTADGRVMGSLPARIVEGLVTTDETGRPVSVIPVWDIGEAPALAISSANPSGSYDEGDPIAGTLTATNATGDVVWSVTGADAGAVTLDPDMGEWSLDATDYETKTSYAFTFTATDDVTSADQVVAIDIDNVLEVTLNALALDDSEVPEDEAATINITGASAGSTISVQSGPLPTGMTLNSGARTIAGTPTTPGAYEFTLRETHADGSNSPRDTALAIEVTEVVEPPVIDTPPAVSGTEQVGSILTATPAVWTGDVDSVAYQWQSSPNGTDTWTDISGAIFSSLELTGTEEGLYIRVGEQASNAGGASAWAYSTATGAIAAAEVPTITASDWVNTPNTSTTVSTTTSCTVNVSLANNRKLIAVVQMGNADTNVVTGVTAGGVAMTLVAGNTVQIDGTREQNTSIWELDNPALGSTTVTATRDGTVSARFEVAAFVLQDAAQAGPVASATPYWDATDGTTFTANSVTATAEGQFALFVSTGELLSGGSFNAPEGTLIGTLQSTSSPVVSKIHFKNAPGAGAVSPGAITTSGNSARGLLGLGILYDAVAGGAVESSFYVDEATGNDADDGLSEANAFASLSAIDGLPQEPGTTFNFGVGGNYRQTAALSSGVSPFALTGSGTSGSRQLIQSYGTGTKPFLGGDVPVASGWGAIGAGEASAYAIANGEKRNMGAAVDPWASYPFFGAKMLHPAQWSPSGGHQEITAWADYQAGSEAVRFAASSQTGLGDTSADFSKEFAYAKAGTAITIYVTHAAIASHYGAIAADALDGAKLVYLANGNIEAEATITNYDQANSRITATITQSGTFNPVGHQTSDVWYAIRFSPFDIELEGQFGISGNYLFAAWPAGGDVRSVGGADTGFVMSASNADIEGVAFGRICDSDNDQQHGLKISGTGITLTDIAARQTLNSQRPSAIAAGGNISSMTVDGVTLTELYTSGGLRFQSFISGSTFNDIYARDLGRTALMFGASGSAAANDITCTNLDMNDCQSVHGNCLTTYTGSYDIEFDKFAVMNSTNPITSQVKNAPSITTPRNNRWKRFIASNPRLTDGSNGGAYAVRIDSGETGSLMDQGVIVTVGSSALYLGAGTGPSGDPTVYGNDGMVINRSVIEGIAASAAGANDVTVSNSLVFFGDGLAGGMSQATLESYGMTFTDCTIVNLSSGDRAAGTGGAWNGCPTVAMQEVLTRSDSWTSGSPTYAQVQIGPDAWGINRDKGPWIIPAYGASFAMSDLWITTDTVTAGFQSGKQIGSIVGGKPGSTLSLPALGDNSLFALDPRGMIRAASRLTAGTYDLVMRETNAGATNGPTRDTTMTIYVVEYFG